MRETAITFEYAVPDVEEFTRRICAVQESIPTLRRWRRDVSSAMLMSARLRRRAAYDWAVRDLNLCRHGCAAHGRRLYAKLEECLKAQGILNVNACIGYPEKEDEYLTRDSVRFHEKLGYKMVGRFHACGYKFDRWYDMVWMERWIGAHVSPQRPFARFPPCAAPCGYKLRFPVSTFIIAVSTGQFRPAFWITVRQPAVHGKNR